MTDPWRRLAVVAYLVTTVMVLLDDAPIARRLGAIGLLLACAAWQHWYGRDATCWLDEGRWPRSVLYVSVLFVLFTPAVWLVGSSAFMLFALIPQIYMALPLWWALGPVVLFALVSWAQQLFDGGFQPHMLPMLGLIVVLSHAFAWVSVTLEEKNRALSDSLELNERLSHEAGVAAERERLSGEIHDTLAQGFTSIVTLIQAAQGDPKAAPKHLDLALRTARENLSEARALVAALAPTALNGTLTEALGRQAERLGEEAGVVVRHRTTGEPRTLPTSVEVVLLRAAQEAFHNVRKHARAKTVEVELVFEREAVRLRVCDDGVGLVGRPEGFGLRGMRARAEQVGGTLAVSGEAGTSLTVRVPL